MRNLRRALSLGCEIGNHSDTHPRALRRFPTMKSFRKSRKSIEKSQSLSALDIRRRLCVRRADISTGMFSTSFMRPACGCIRFFGIRIPAIGNSIKKWQDGEISYEEAVESAVIACAFRGGKRRHCRCMTSRKHADVLDRVLDALCRGGLFLCDRERAFRF